MAGDVSLELWLHEYKMKALNAAYAEIGTDIETVMQDYLVDMYYFMVPADKQTEIQQRIADEQRMRDVEREANSTFGVFHVRENGSEEYYRTKLFSDLLGAARALRRHLRDEGEACGPFAERFTDRTGISAKDFEKCVLERMDNTGRIVGAYDIDFEKREFSGVNM